MSYNNIPFIPLPDPSDPDYWEKLYDIEPEARPPRPTDYYVVDLTSDVYGERGYRPADADDRSFFDVPWLKFTPPREVIDLTDDEDDAMDTDDDDEISTVILPPPVREEILNNDELRHTFTAPEVPLDLPLMPEYPRQVRHAVDFDALCHRTWFEAHEDEYPQAAFARLHEYECLWELEEEEGNLRSSMEHIYRLTEVLRKYEEARKRRVRNGEYMPRWFEKRLEELEQRKSDYLRFLRLL